MLGVFRKFSRYAAALAAVCCALLPARALAADSVLILQASPRAGETVYPGDAISYSVSVGRDGEHLDWAWLRVTMGEGMDLVEGSILLDCAKAIPVDLLPPGEDGAPAASPLPITRDTILGSDGFVLLSSALLNGDTISFMAVAEEGASLSLTAVLGGESVSVTHALGERPPEQTVAPEFVYVPPEGNETSDGLPLWAKSLIAAICVVAICAGVYYLLYRLGIAPSPAELLGGAPQEKGAAVGEASVAAQRAAEVKQEMKSKRMYTSPHLKDAPGKRPMAMPSDGVRIPNNTQAGPSEPTPLEPTPLEPMPLEPMPWSSVPGAFAQPAGELRIPPNPYAPPVHHPVQLPVQPPVQPLGQPPMQPAQRVDPPAPFAGSEMQESWAAPAAPPEGGQEAISLEEVHRLAEQYQKLLEKQAPGPGEPDE